MSSFAGIHFKVAVVSDHWFPGIELDDEGKYTYQCRAYFAQTDKRTSMADWVTLGTWKRPLGTISPIFHLEAGRGEATLVFPQESGSHGFVSAVLVGMRNVEGYAKHLSGGYMADLSFVLLTRPW